MLGAAGLLVLSIVANLVKPWPLALIVDHLLGNKPLPQWLAAALAGWERSAVLALLGASLVLLHTIQAGFSMAQNYLVIQVGLRGLARVRNQLFHWLQRLSLRYHQQASQGDLIYRASWDTYAFQTLFQQGLFTAVSAALSLTLMVGVMWQLNRVLALVALGTVPLLLLTMQSFGAGMRRRSLVAQAADSRVTALVQQSIVALPLTQSYTQEEREQRRFTEQAAEALRRRVTQHGYEVVYLAVIAIIFGLGVGGIAWVGARQVWTGNLTVGQLWIFLAYLGQFYEPLNQLTSASTTVSAARAGTQRVFEILDAAEEVKDRPGARAVLAPASATGPADVRRTPSAPDGPLLARGHVRFDRVSFGYRPGQRVLTTVSFELRAGQSTAIIGPSGAGKSTLAHLLPRFFDPTEGRILLEEADLRDLRLNDLRAQVALVMQEPILLAATVAENIGFGKPDASRAEIEAAAQAAHAHGFIDQLPQRYDTPVGEGAVRLSVGEKQRISLARAFLKNAPILVLDEPTSALDAENEALVVSSLNELMRGRTTLAIAHRLPTIRHVDQILVLEGGRLTASGTPAELLQQGGYYARLMSPQPQPEAERR